MEGIFQGQLARRKLIFLLRVILFNYLEWNMGTCRLKEKKNPILDHFYNGFSTPTTSPRDVGRI